MGVNSLRLLFDAFDINQVKVTKPQSTYGASQHSHKKLQSSLLVSEPPEIASEPPENDVEPSTNAVEVAPTVWKPYKNRFRFPASCFLALCSGFSDSAPGPLLLYIEKDYSIGYAVVSTIFVAQAIGFICAAFFINSITNKFGRSKALMLASLLLVASYVTLVVEPLFPVVALGFFLMGLGAAINLAICNVFVANLQHGAFYQGIYQGIYGVGGTVGPLIATSLVNKGLHWSTYYYLPLGIAVFSMGSCGWAFKGFEKDTPQHHNGQPTSTSRRARSRKIFTSKPTIFGGMFIFAYQGAEVAISGWIVSFLVSYRGGDLSKVGYVTSGFWGGITIGRFLLSYVGSLVGERIFVFVITAGTLVLQLLVWFVPSVIGDSIAVALAGVLLGPIYPAATVTFVRLIPKQMQVSSFSFIAGVGSSGGAFVPFLTGLLAQQAGTWVLHPICISLFVAMIGTWFLLSEKHRSTD